MLIHLISIGLCAGMRASSMALRRRRTKSMSFEYSMVFPLVTSVQVNLVDIGKHTSNTSCCPPQSYPKISALVATLSLVPLAVRDGDSTAGAVE